MTHSIVDVTEKKMKHAGVNTDPIIPAIDKLEEDYSRCRLRERKVLHIRIKEQEELTKIYDLGETIGKGGFGVVLEVTEKHTAKKWAMKTVVKTMAGTRLKLVSREIQILKLIQHPHIIHLSKVYESAKKIYMILERCCGELAKVYHEQKPFTENLSRKIIKELSQAVIYLHKHDIVHRDLKLENILIGENPSDPNDHYFIKLTDFGLSIIKYGFGIDSMLHEYCGTLTYMAPEILSRSCSYSQQCDNWAIGVILYMLVVGRYPFYSKLESELQSLICTTEPNFDNLKLSVEVTNLINKLLEKNPAVRFTAAEILEHPWTLAKSMTSTAVTGNIFEIMKEWKSDLILPGVEEESDWVTAENKDRKAVARTRPKTINNEKDEYVLRVVNPRQNLPLAVTDIKFQRGSRAGALKTNEFPPGTPSVLGKKDGTSIFKRRDTRDAPYPPQDSRKQRSMAIARPSGAQSGSTRPEESENFKGKTKM